MRGARVETCTSFFKGEIMLKDVAIKDMIDKFLDYITLTPLDILMYSLFIFAAVTIIFMFGYNYGKGKRYE